ncbi:MAG: hypothetical protein R3C69_06820 [Geminicoccaceae bacterium]
MSVEDLQALLADRQGYPGSINAIPALTRAPASPALGGLTDRRARGRPHARDAAIRL